MSIDLNAIAAKATERGVFASVTLHGQDLECAALEAAAATYSLHARGDQVTVRLRTTDRWLSESIETDLMHFGDSIEDLVADELIELGGDGKVPKIRHFRNDAREFVFENDLPQADDRAALLFLLAYEAAFRQLGDMGGSDGDE
ncbi:MAG: hypothetical protein FJ270_07825 [Planctomycetes bacterium]|nr:hypothetical protein [Planctomycetota bacterium]